MLRYGSMCTGIDAPQQALIKAGIPYENKFSIEFDKYARQVYLSNYGNQGLLLEDVRKTDFNSLPDIDLFFAGFPCQDLSVAGDGKGLKGDRSSLILNIIEYLRLKNPAVFCLENVPGLITKKHIGDFNFIMGKLAKEINRQTSIIEPVSDCLNYYVHYKVLNSMDYGIPQDRDRVFIIGFKDYDSYLKFEWPEKQVLKLRLKDVLQENIPDKYFLSQKALDGLLKHRENQKEAGRGFGLNILDMDSTANTYGIGPGSLERNLVYPTISSRYHKTGSETFRKVSEPEITTNTYSKRFGIGKEIDIAHCIDTDLGHRGVNRNQYQTAVVQRVNPGKISQGGRIYSVEGLAICQASTGGGQGANTGLYAIPVLTPDRPEKRQNGRRFKTDGEPMFTITGSDRHGIYDGCKIRKLTEREVLRLFGFPDSFDISGVSMTQAYKMGGNSIVVDVLVALFKQIIKVM